MRAVFAALAANLAIAVTKFIAFAITGSASMLAEAVHSVADTGNEVLLIVDPGQDQRVAAQQRAVAELAAQRRIGLSELAMDDEHPLVRLAGVVQLADYASVYLAIASGIDPSQTAAVTDLQARIE